MTETQASEQTYDTILVETRGRVGVITLNRPKALNALNAQVLADVLSAARAFDADDGIGAILLTGSEKAFAAGADIKEMSERGFSEMFATDWFGAWQELAQLRTPTIAAVSGYALGGGCELAMLCDLLIAADSATFGQPEINLGVLPGMGGSQRLTRAIGRPKAMDMVLTGRQMDAAEAESAGLVSRVVPADQLLEQAMDIAETIASKSLMATMAAKEAVNAALETPLSQGLISERRLFHSLFATEDQKEGMAAFVEKREPQFRHR
ncbi:enoyl-CoA hydratase [Kocuria palustris]|uniref:enoyl-CoA hydratase n=1 Tax=Kocuria palustris TaxID=71999 RepID=UPI0011A6DD13|nr:enoyl-CoA hydratase [Kocuria palustris]